MVTKFFKLHLRVQLKEHTDLLAIREAYPRGIENHFRKILRKKLHFSHNC